MPTAKKTTRRKKKGAPEPRGLEAVATGAGNPPAAIEQLTRSIAEDGGASLGAYRDPLGGHWQILAALQERRRTPSYSFSAIISSTSGVSIRAFGFLSALTRSARTWSANF